MNEEQSKAMEQIANQLQTVKAGCEQKLRSEHILKSVWVSRGKGVLQSARSMASTLVNDMVLAAPVDLPEQFQIESLIPVLKQIKNILSRENLKALVKFDPGFDREIDERMSMPEFKQALSKLLQ